VEITFIENLSLLVLIIINIDILFILYQTKLLKEPLLIGHYHVRSLRKGSLEVTPSVPLRRNLCLVQRLALKGKEMT